MPPRHGREVPGHGNRNHPSPKKRREHPRDGAVRSVVRVRAWAREGVEPTVTALVRAARVIRSRGARSSDLQTPQPQEAAAPCGEPNGAGGSPQGEKRSAMHEGAEPSRP